MKNDSVAQAVKLLRDNNLVWSNDLVDVRKELADLLIVCTENLIIAAFANILAEKLISTAPTKATYNRNLETRDLTSEILATYQATLKSYEIS